MARQKPRSSTYRRASPRRDDCYLDLSIEEIASAWSLAIELDAIHRRARRGTRASDHQPDGEAEQD